MDDKDFLQQCAIAAMQGIQESGHYLGLVSDFTPNLLAERAFDIAEAMLAEFHKRRRPEYKPKF